MKTLLLIACILFTATGFPQAAPSGLDPQVESAITRLREGLVDSFNHDDIDRLLTFLDSDAVVTWQNGEVCEGTAAVKAYYDRMMKGSQPIVKKVTADPKILGRHVQGDWAVSWGNLNDRFELTDGRTLQFNSHFTATIVRRVDGWRVTAFHVSVNAFENPVMALAVKQVAWIVGCLALVVGLVVGFITPPLVRRRLAPSA